MKTAKFTELTDLPFVILLLIACIHCFDLAVNIKQQTEVIFFFCQTNVAKKG